MNSILLGDLAAGLRAATAFADQADTPRGCETINRYVNSSTGLRHMIH
ncbi:hypothetical protein AB0J42_26450 [Nonomuraea sp. NPDC049649]